MLNENRSMDNQEPSKIENTEDEKKILKIINAKPQEDLDKNEYYFLAFEAYKQKDFYTAIANLNKAIKLDDKEAKFYRNRGLAKAKLKKYKEAIKDYDKAIAIKPNDEDAYYNRGNAKAKLEKYKEAIKDYDKAIAINPNFVEAIQNKALAEKILKEQPNKN